MAWVEKKMSIVKQGGPLLKIYDCCSHNCRFEVQIPYIYLKRLGTYLLLESIDDINLVYAEFHSSWVELACTIKSDKGTEP
jgi:hypothetical protein